MSFPELKFPLEIDCAEGCYWIGISGLYKYGEAVTALFSLELIPDDADQGLSLTRELAQYLQAFGSFLAPFAGGLSPKVPDEIFHGPVSAGVQCAFYPTYHPLPEKKQLVLVNRYTFQTLHDFLLFDLLRGIHFGNAPRQCRRCKRWFFHEQGEKALYCDRPVSNEDPRTCRIVGAAEVFEQKMRDEKPWEYYKRAYKKYYARMMKGNMSKEDFNAWTVQAQRLRDEALNAWYALSDMDEQDDSAEIEKNRILEGLKKSLNEK